MANDRQRIVQGSVFRFLVGKHQRPMTVHTALVAEQSSALRALVSGFMEEANIGTAVWEDVEEDTFAQFAQFVYTGDYPPPSCKTTEDPQVAAPEPIEFADEVVALQEPEQDMSQNLNDWGELTPKERRAAKKRGTQSIKRVAFHDLTYKASSSAKFVDMCRIRSNESSSEDYGPVFLGHARLYVFAEKWGVRSLKDLVLQKLHVTLREYKPYEARYGDVVELIRYAYENTPSCKRMDGLRELATQYVAHETPQIAGSEPCLSLVEDGGPFAKDLLSMVLEKVP